MSLFSRKQTSPRGTLLLDIGSSRVIGARVTHPADNLPVILHTAREAIVFQDSFEPKRYLKSATKSLRTSAESLVRLGLPPPDRIIATISPLLAVSSAKTITRENLDSTIVTKKLIDSLLEEAKKLFVIEQKRGIVLEATLDDVRINGYRVQYPLGKRADTISGTVFVSLIDQQTDEALRAALEPVFHERPVLFHTFPFAATTAIRHAMNLENFRYLEWGGEVAEMVSVYDGAIRCVESAPLGGNHLIRAIGRELALSPGLAKTKLERLAVDWDKDILRNSDRPIAHVKKSLHNFLTKREGVPDLSRIPLLVLADPVLRTLFASMQANQSLGFDVRFLTSEAMSTFCRHNGDATRDPYIMLASIFSGIMKARQ